MHGSEFIEPPRTGWSSSNRARGDGRQRSTARSITSTTRAHLLDLRGFGGSGDESGVDRRFAMRRRHGTWSSSMTSADTVDARQRRVRPSPFRHRPGLATHWVEAVASAIHDSYIDRRRPRELSVRAVSTRLRARHHHSCRPPSRQAVGDGDDGAPGRGLWPGRRTSVVIDRGGRSSSTSTSGSTNDALTNATSCRSPADNCTRLADWVKRPSGSVSTNRWIGSMIARSDRDAQHRLAKEVRSDKAIEQEWPPERPPTYAARRWTAVNGNAGVTVPTSGREAGDQSTASSCPGPCRRWQPADPRGRVDVQHWGLSPPRLR